MAMTKKSIEYLEKTYNAVFDEKENAYITECAGFIPLEVKFKRFEQAGQIMQFSTSEFTSNDLRQIYLNPDFEITPEDDIEDVREKLLARQEYIMQLRKSKVGSFEKTADSPSDSAAAAEESVQTNEPKEVPQ